MRTAQDRMQNMSSITKAYIQQPSEDDHDEPSEPHEHLDVLRILEGRGVSCELFSRKTLERNRLSSPLAPSTLVVGDHDVMKRTFRLLGVPKDRLPRDTYPPSVKSYLKRKVWRSTAGRVREAASAGAMPAPVFVKPVDDTKKFTGLVVGGGPSSGDPSPLYAVSKKTEVYCSEAVEWLSEYRVFVNNRSEVVGVRPYSGDASIELDMTVVEDFVRDFESSDEATCAYAADFGVMMKRKDDGGACRTTALVEWNDGYALGSYGLNAEVYTDLLLSRWEEIHEERQTA